jgi:predicted hydrocarbon binding protein
MKDISQEVLEDIYRLLGDLVGQGNVDIFKRIIEEKGTQDIAQIIFEIADEMGKIFGPRGAYATLRQIGRQIAQDLMKAHPKEEWEKIFKEALAVMGFAKEVVREGNKAYVYSCRFYPQFLEPKGLKPTEHPVCWIGLGFIEGFMNVFNRVKGIRFAGRDFEKQQCWFEIIASN